MGAKHLIGIAAIVLVLGGGATYFLTSESRISTNNTSQVAMMDAAVSSEDVAPTVPETKQISADWRRYENKKFRFGLLYPKELAVREYNESGGALSVVFAEQANGQGRGFQIYVTPYDKDHITQERFRLDVSSGVMKEPVEIVIAGVSATMFWSSHSIMGETREVWFIKNGYLYEVVTYKELDPWLATIMQTWTFI